MRRFRLARVGAKTVCPRNSCRSLEGPVIAADALIEYPISPRRGSPLCRRCHASGHATLSARAARHDLVLELSPAIGRRFGSSASLHFPATASDARRTAGSTVLHRPEALSRSQRAAHTAGSRVRDRGAGGVAARPIVSTDCAQAGPTPAAAAAVSENEAGNSSKQMPACAGPRVAPRCLVRPGTRERGHSPIEMPSSILYSRFFDLGLGCVTPGRALNRGSASTASGPAPDSSSRCRCRKAGRGASAFFHRPAGRQSGRVRE